MKVALFTMLGGTLLLYGVRASPVPTLDPTLLSSGFLESSYGFSAGAIAIYFLHRRKMLWGFLGICVTVLLFKRTAILAVFVLGVLPLIFPVSRGERRLPFAALVGICAAIAIAGLEANRIFEFLYSSLGLTQSLNAYTLGRYGYNALLESALRDASLTQQILGSGPGAAERALTIAFGGTASSNIQPHNDFLRILFEYGWVGLGVFLFSLCRIFASSTLLQKLLIYQMILFVTDNTLIYLFHFVVLSLLLGADNKEPVRERLAT